MKIQFKFKFVSFSINAKGEIVSYDFMHDEEPLNWKVCEQWKQLNSVCSMVENCICST